ncbi:hypothetical protein [Burkholderia ubonensis]|uniref:hypothetical protein n=1 Tax=Burkholderia ubonensis TaxID=101571 RepID=UPI000770C111|nr:hypothetical protein [Burkholderia ubonensis]KVT01075.1 hypothetical protein WK47_24680 [Burkholderia ubonensis]KVT07491.1 hypothetical protein WK46_11215 [Burkholderia ubonensis]
MSKTSGLALVFSLILLARGAMADTLDVLVDKQRQALVHEMDKKLQDDSGAKQTQAPATLPSQLQSAAASAEADAKKVAHNPVDDLRVNAIYGVNGMTTVDVSIGDGPSYPITKDRSIKGWTIAKVSPSSVTFRNVRTKVLKTIYLAEPTTSPAPTTQTTMAGGMVPPVGMPMPNFPRMGGQ